MIFSYGLRRLWTNAFSFCCTAILAKAEISSMDCRLSLESLIHWRMIFRRASRCLFITSGMCAAPWRLAIPARSYQDDVFGFSVSSASNASGRTPNSSIGRLSVWSSRFYRSKQLLCKEALPLDNWNFGQKFWCKVLDLFTEGVIGKRDFLFTIATALASFPRWLRSPLAPPRIPDDTEVQRLRELSYIREAERFERKRVTTREPSEQISAALDALARDFLARALQNKSKE